MKARILGLLVLAALLPEPLRPPRWREAVVALGGLSFALLVVRVLAQVLLGL